jgi:hypothetical protein
MRSCSLIGELRRSSTLHHSDCGLGHLRLLWSDNGGGDTGSDASQQRLTATYKTDEGMEEEWIEDVPSDEVMIEETGMGVQVLEEQEEQHEVVEEVRRWANSRPQRTNSPFGTWTKWEAETGQLKIPPP